MPLTCAICVENPSKYKCPKCKILYCSLACYKTHKENQCDQLVNANANANAKGELVDAVVTAPLDENPEWKLSRQQLEQLERSKPVRHAIRDSRLQQLIRNVDGSDDRVAALERLMAQDENFKQFVETMMVEINV